MKTIAFFNNKGGVGKTSLVYHLSWMFADLGVPVLAVDMDPQSNLTSMFLKEERLEQIWDSDSRKNFTISDCIRPQIAGSGDILDPFIEKITPDLGLLCGNLELSGFEDVISHAWKECFSRDERGFRITSAFHRMIFRAVQNHPAKIILIDVGPNLGAINRATMIASNFIALPLAPDLFSIQGLKNLGPTLIEWRNLWAEAKNKMKPQTDLLLPDGQMKPVGYIVMQHSIKDSRPVKAYQRWLDKIPETYRQYVMDEKNDTLSIPVTDIDKDPYKLALLKHYRSLMAMAQEHNKPIFHLKSADGAIGAHAEAVESCRKDFRRLALKIAGKIGVDV